MVVKRSPSKTMTMNKNTQTWEGEMSDERQAELEIVVRRLRRQRDELLKVLIDAEHFLANVPTGAQLDARPASGITGRKIWQQARAILAKLDGGG